MRITLYKDEVQQILDIFNKFDISKVEVIQDSSSGIGTTLSVAFDTELKEQEVRVVIDLTDVENW